MKALLIADGERNRLIEDEPRSLARLLGISLIERAVLTAKRADMAEFVIVICYGGERIRTHLGCGDRYGIKIDYIENSKWKKGDGFSVLKAKELLNENFVLLMSDHIADERVLEKGGKIVDISENIQNANCVGTGIFLFSYVEEATKGGQR